MTPAPDGRRLDPPPGHPLGRQWRLRAALWHQQLAPLRLLLWAALAVAAWAWGVWVPQRIESHAAAATRQALAAAALPQATHDDTAGALAAWRRVLPPADQAPRWFLQFQSAALAHGLDTGRVDYRWDDRRRVQVGLPLRGTYPQLRAYLQALLDRHAAVSVDQLSVQRDDQDPTRVSAMLWLSLWFDTLVEGPPR